MKKGESKYVGKYQQGEEIGLWTVISKIPFPDYETFKCYCVKVKCKCGNEQVVPCHRFEYKHSNGCQHCKIAGTGSYLWRGVGEISGRLLSQIKNSAKVRKIEHDVSGDYLWELFLKQGRKCALTGEELVFDSSHFDKNTASLDRIDSSKGYVEGNVMWVHKHINLMKHVFDLDYFVDLCGKIYGRRKKIQNRDFWKADGTY
jgi:hypothetical protein